MKKAPRYAAAAYATCEIINLHSNPAIPTPERYSRILYCILAAIYAAEQEIYPSIFEPSAN